MPEYTPNGLLFKQIHDRLEKQSNNALRAKDLTMMQVSVLMALQQAAEQRLSMKELERYFGVAQSTVAGIVSRLEQKDLVEAFGDTADSALSWYISLLPEKSVALKLLGRRKTTARLFK